MNKDQMHLLDLEEAIDQLARANSVLWYGHVLKKNKYNLLKRVIDIKVKGIAIRPMKTWLITFVK